MLINPYTFLIQLINVAILFYFLKRWLFQPLSVFFEKRREDIKQQYKEAERQELDSQRLYEEYRRRIEDSRKEVRSMIKEAEREAEETRLVILEQARQEAEKFMARSREEIETEKNKVSRELLEQSMNFSLVLASKVLEQKISKEEHHEIIRQIIDRMDEREWVQ